VAEIPIDGLLLASDLPAKSEKTNAWPHRSSGPDSRLVDAGTPP